jgi:hypothetical protein
VCKIALSISLLIVPLLAGAQTAEDYFHRGAQFYIHGKKQEAKTEIFTGLKQFPADPQLNGLAVLLKKEQEDQKQQSQQQNQQTDQQKKDQQKQDQQQQQEQKRDSAQQNQEKKQEQQQQANQSQEQKERQAEQAAAKAKEDAEEKERQAAYAAGQMTTEQAQQLLDAQKSEEKMLPVKPENKPEDHTRPFKDW